MLLNCRYSNPLFLPLPQSPYYSANSKSLRNTLISSDVPSLRINNNGFLFSAYEDNSASATSTSTPSDPPSELDYIAAANKRYMYCNPATTSAHDEPMHDVQ